MSQGKAEAFLSQGFPDLICNIVLWPVSLDLHYSVLVKVYDLHESHITQSLIYMLMPCQGAVQRKDGGAGRQRLTGFVCVWKALKRAFSVSALSSFLLIRGSPVTSSLPGVFGGANFSWYERPLAGCMSRPVTLST